MTAGGGIVHEHLPAADTLHHEVVIEFPENDEGRFQAAELIDLAAQCARFETKLASGPQDGRGRGTIARDFTESAQPGCSFTTAEIVEDDAQRRGSAFDKLHLQDGTGVDAATETIREECSHSASLVQTERFFDRRDGQRDRPLFRYHDAGSAQRAPGNSYAHIAVR